MSEICKKCGLDKSICVCDIVAKEEEKIRVSHDKKRYGKHITLISGISKDIDIKDILKQLKTKMACGGTIKDNVIELQGDHRRRIKEILVRLGFPEENIEVI
ncbi:MAG: stress response translation initiation inhibitor YciH [Candidatus Aenigmarchaeota archaeon]|nr:stress response translation initiation inhibitor YciH [Candidatus Aenigmarchaeota archaeon]